MRRDEFAMEERREIEVFLQEMSFGLLGTVSEDGWPEMTPLNFVYANGSIYFHGSKVGRKMEHLQRDPRAAFLIAKEYAVIPSYFSNPKYACPATTYFKSVSIRGTTAVVTDLHEKAGVLGALMRKLQPEGGYDPITPDDPGYLSQIRGVAVVRLTMDSISAKFKFGQNVSENRHANLTRQLEERGRPLDLETAELMRKYCPHHREQT